MSQIAYYFLVGNKLDLSDNRKVDENIARDFATQNSMGFLETSARSSTNVDVLFKQIATGIHNK